MELTRDQVMERLGVGQTAVERLVASGALVPCNTRKPGAQKWFKRFDAKAVEEYRRLHPKTTAHPGWGGRRVRAPNGSDGQPLTVTATTDVRPVAEAPTATTAPAINAATYATTNATTGLRTQLDRIEAKLDRLLAVWS